MKAILFTMLFLAINSTLHAQKSSAFKPPKTPGFETTLTVQNTLTTLEKLAERTPQYTKSAAALTQGLKHDAVNYAKLPPLVAEHGFMHAIDEYYNKPLINFNAFTEFASLYKITNVAYYEANKNTIFSQQYALYCPSMQL